MLPRFFTNSSTKSSCSRVRRPIHPRLYCPSITIPLCGHSSRVTINSFPLTGSRVISGYIQTHSSCCVLLRASRCRNSIHMLQSRPNRNHSRSQLSDQPARSMTTSLHFRQQTHLLSLMLELPAAFL